MSKISYLGHVFANGQYSPDPKKIEIIQNFPTLTSPKQVKSFLGLSGYYPRFIRNFSDISAPLLKLVRKNTKFLWTPECEAAFNTLKKALTSEPVLTFPNFEEPMHLYCDASGVALGWILGQFKDDKPVVINYGGRILQKAEQNYIVTHLEALACIEGIKANHAYLFGKKFFLYTDHASLTWLFKSSSLKGKFARWALLLQTYQYKIIHTKGKLHVHADALSRLQLPGTLQDSSSHTIVTDAQSQEPAPAGSISQDDSCLASPQISESNEILAISEEQYDPERIKQHQRSDPELVELIMFLQDNTPYSTQVHRDLSAEQAENFYLSENGLLYKYADNPRPYNPQELLVIPQSLRKEIIAQNHDHPLSAHLGLTRTWHKIKIRYFWPGAFPQVKDWIATCMMCVQNASASMERLKLPSNPYLSALTLNAGQLTIRDHTQFPLRYSNAYAPLG